MYMYDAEVHNGPTLRVSRITLPHRCPHPTTATTRRVAASALIVVTAVLVILVLAAEHGDVVKRLFGRIAAHNASHVPNTAFPPFDNASCPQPQPMTKQTVWMPWRKDGAPEGV